MSNTVMSLLRTFAHKHLHIGAYLALLALGPGCMAGKVSGTAASIGQNANTDTMTGVAMASSTHLPEASACVSQSPAPRGLRRLTLAEFNSTLQDLFADPNVPQATGLFTGDARLYGFDNIQTSLAVRDNQAMALSNFAETAGQYAGAKSLVLAGCDTTLPACQQTFVQVFGRKAFRRPLTDGEITTYTALMAQATTAQDSVATLVTAMLQSPYFVYRSELGVLDPGGSGQYRLTPYEVATELSYMLTGTMPDGLLSQAADNNQLDDKGIQAQGVRLLATAKAHDAIDRFFLQWLQVDDLVLQARSEGTSVLSPTIKTAMRLETQAFVDDTVFAQKGGYADLMGRDATFLNADLALFYTGATAPPALVPATTALGLNAVQATGAGRLKGVLGQGGVLSAASQPTYASPTLRGRMLRMRILCGSIAPPPPGVPPLPPAMANQTLRQRFEAHTKGSTCASCHAQMDPLAYPFGAFDTLGRARAGGTEDGLALDLSGSINGPMGANIVAGPSDLTAELAQSPEGAACLARHWSMYALGRLSWPQDGCTFEAVAKAAAAKQNNLQAMLLALTQANSFTVRVKDP